MCNIAIMKRFLPLLILIVGLLVNGCMPPSTTQSPQKTWQSFKDKDQFTDLESCNVSVNSKTRTFAYTTLGYIPYIELKNDTLRLGLHNINGIPVGDIQLRIDENKFHTITTSETPIDLFPQELSSNMENSMNMVNKESLGAGINYETMMNNMMIPKIINTMINSMNPIPCKIYTYKSNDIGNPSSLNSK